MAAVISLPDGGPDDLERVVNFYNRLLGEHPGEKGLYGRIRKVKTKLEHRGVP